MTKLQLRVHPVYRREGASGYLPLLPDETISSWARRHPGIQLSSEDNNEDAFGDLAIHLPAVPRALRQQLRRAAEPPDDWLLKTHQRTIKCARCVAEDWARGVPPYERRAWSVAWRTCCRLHGPMFDTNGRWPLPDWGDQLGRPRWNGRYLAIMVKRVPLPVLDFSLGNDRRAIHLESALEGRCPGAWYPNGMTASSLREIYGRIVSALLAQFYLPKDGLEDEHPNPGFNRAINANRFAVNVMAEAILSVWTHTPLPAQVLAQRTHLLVRAIGWSSEMPDRYKLGQVLFRGPSKRTAPLMGYTDLLPSGHYSKLVGAASDCQWGHLTLPEARVLGMNVSKQLAWLSTLTRQGYFLSFDGRDGCLTKNPFLPEQDRLEPRAAEPHGAILPAWAFRPSRPMTRADVLFSRRRLFGPASPEEALIERAYARRSKRQERGVVRYLAGHHLVRIPETGTMQASLRAHCDMA